jgi:uncharacterized RDD family membrane protein YckC
MERGPLPPDPNDPERPRGPETPTGPQAPAPGPQAPPPRPQAPPEPPGYGGPVPPGGWQQPIARQEAGWVGRPLATWGSRVAAQVIDWLVLLVPAAILVALVVGGNDSDSWGAIIGTSLLALLIWSVILLLYAPLLMRRQGERNGQTLGKQFVGITVVRDTGEPFGFWYSVLREVVVKNILVSAVSIFIPVLPWLLDNLWPLWDGENRAIHDMIVSTHVVKV